MKARMVSWFILAGLLFAACSPAGAPATEAAPIPTVVADDTLIAEGRVEPVPSLGLAHKKRESDESGDEADR